MMTHKSERYAGWLSIEFFQESDARAIAAMVIVRQISVQNRKRRGNGDPRRKWAAW